MAVKQPLKVLRTLVVYCKIHRLWPWVLMIMACQWVFTSSSLMASALPTTEANTLNSSHKKSLTISGAYIRAVPPGAAVTAAFLTLENTSQKPRALLGVSTSMAGKSELHAHKHIQGKMAMRPIARLTLPAQSVVEFKPGGNHIMLYNLQRDLTVGSKVPIALTFDEDEVVTVIATIQ